MISGKMEQALNEQVKYELYSSYLYMSMAMYFHGLSLKGFANWMEVQAKEEQAHAEKFMHYINDAGGRVVLQAIDQPPADFKSPQQVFEETLKHERFVTGRINGLIALAREENDNAAYAMLQWFITEQVEEEATADEFVNQLKIIGDNGHGLLMLDREMISRVFVPPTAAAN
jgi:ferritin